MMIEVVKSPSKIELIAVIQVLDHSLRTRDTADMTMAAIHPVQLQRLRTLAAQAGVTRLELFGSAARGVEAPHDFDFVVSFEKMSPLEHGRAYLKFMQVLEDELQAPVELIEDEAISNIYFRRAIQNERLLIYAR